MTNAEHIDSDDNNFNRKYNDLANSKRTKNYKVMIPKK